MNAHKITNDQWMPVMCVKPDGTKLFMGWCDRRSDTNNSLIDVYGRWATIASNGDVSFFTTDFRITTTNFPPVFTGLINTNAGTFDPAYPPADRNDGTNCPTFLGTYSPHMGDYDMPFSDNQYVYYTWGDNRDVSAGTITNRNQANIRFVRVSWP